MRSRKRHRALMTALSKKAIPFTMVLGLFFALQTPLARGKTTLVFLTWKPNQPAVWNGLLERFHRENPQIQVKRQVGPHSSTQYHAIATQRLKNRDSSMDVFFMDVTWPPGFAQAGWVAELGSWFSRAERREFLSGPVSANTYLGGIYGVPCYLGAGLFYYRKDLLQQHGFAPPRHWDEMIHHGQALLKDQGDPDLQIYSAQFKQYEGLVCNMLEFIWSNGGRVWDGQGGTSCLSKPATIEALAFVRDRIIGKAAPQGAVNYEEPESLDLFVQGKALFHRNWPYAWAVMNNPKKSRIAGKAGVGPLPAFPGHQSASTLGGWQFGMSRWSTHQEEAWRFIEFMTSHRSQKFLALEAGLAPTRTSVYTDPEVQEKMPHLSAFLPAFKKARPRPLTPLYPMVSQVLQRFFSRAIVERSSRLSELAQVASEKMDKLLELGARIQK